MKRTFLFSVVGLLAANAGFFHFAAIANGQSGRLIEQKELKEFENIKTNELFRIIDGTTPIQKEQEEIIRRMARYYVLYMTIPEHQRNGNTLKRRADFNSRMMSLMVPYQADRESMEYYELKMLEYSKANNATKFREAKSKYDKLKAKHDSKYKKNKEFRKRFGKELVECFQQVFVTDMSGRLQQDPISCINAALMLPVAAQMDEPVILNYLTDLVRDPGKPLPLLSAGTVSMAASPLGLSPLCSMSLTAPGRNYGRHDAVKLFAFQALQTYYTHTPPRLKAYTAESERQKLAAQLNPIIDYILRSPTSLANATPAELDGYRYIRNDAIQALAKVPLALIPGLPHVQKRTRGEILAPVAYAHLRVILTGGDAIDPPAQLIEKCHAALGLCHIDATLNLEEDLPSRYNPDISVALVGQFLVEFLQAYQRDLPKIKTQGVELPPKLAWKVYAQRLKYALDRFELHLPKESKAASTAAELVTQAKIALDKVRYWKSVDNLSFLIDAVRSMSISSPDVYEETSYKLDMTWPPF